MEIEKTERDAQKSFDWSISLGGIPHPVSATSILTTIQSLWGSFRRLCISSDCAESAGALFAPSLRFSVFVLLSPTFAPKSADKSRCEHAGTTSRVVMLSRPPGCVNLQALLARFVMICINRVSSPTTSPSPSCSGTFSGSSPRATSIASRAI